tara:strand:- start:47620 stop:47844 length:225 start_codon:yes stop_codon:yes gene_type:complete
MTDILILLTILATWFILNVWILPRFGMKTCLSGFCNIDSHIKSRSQQLNAKSDLESVQPDEITGSDVSQTGDFK